MSLDPVKNIQIRHRISGTVYDTDNVFELILALDAGPKEGSIGIICIGQCAKIKL